MQQQFRYVHMYVHTQRSMYINKYLFLICRLKENKKTNYLTKVILANFYFFKNYYANFEEMKHFIKENYHTLYTYVRILLYVL